MGVTRKVVQGLEFAAGLAGRADWDGGGWGCGWAADGRCLSADWVEFGPSEAPLRHEKGMKWEEAAPRQRWLARLRPLRSLYCFYSTGWSITTMPSIFGQFRRIRGLVCLICRFDTGLRVLTRFSASAGACPLIVNCAMNGTPATHVDRLGTT
jgi:hypothetical protein